MELQCEGHFSVLKRNVSHYRTESKWCQSTAPPLKPQSRKPIPSRRRIPSANIPSSRETHHPNTTKHTPQKPL